MPLNGCKRTRRAFLERSITLGGALLAGVQDTEVLELVAGLMSGMDVDDGSGGVGADWRSHSGLGLCTGSSQSPVDEVDGFG